MSVAFQQESVADVVRRMFPGGFGPPQAPAAPPAPKRLCRDISVEECDEYEFCSECPAADRALSVLDGGLADEEDEEEEEEEEECCGECGDGGEVRVVNATTGGEKGAKLARFDLIPVQPLFEVAEHFGRGAQKYSERNFERGIDYSLSFAAMIRHAYQWWNGEQRDEIGSHHLAAAAWHCLALMELERTFPEGDDRPKDRAQQIYGVKTLH